VISGSIEGHHGKCSHWRGYERSDILSQSGIDNDRWQNRRGA
jgi:hypothetical protein